MQRPDARGKLSSSSLYMLEEEEDALIHAHASLCSAFTCES
eukprot:COSAG03_NODE_10031_length_677_cov_1.053633_2_plen_40_part_01